MKGFHRFQASEKWVDPQISPLLKCPQLGNFFSIDVITKSILGEMSSLSHISIIIMLLKIFLHSNWMINNKTEIHHHYNKTTIVYGEIIQLCFQKELPTYAVGPGLFRLHPQKGRTICTFLTYQAFKSLGQNLLSYSPFHKTLPRSS